jgi:hypothetical protein
MAARAGHHSLSFRDIASDEPGIHISTSLFKQPRWFSDRHCEPTGRASARPMTGSAKQSMAPQVKAGLLRRFRFRSLSYGGQVAPRNDGV